ncbi:hypothetical protein PMAYCL1PPCAC_30268, partial [Pristionchus mayeri]
KSFQTAAWQVDMVCEMFDALDECQSVLKAARVIKVLPEGFVQVGPEGADIVTDSIIVHQSSPILFPVGYAKEHSITLQGPKGDNVDLDENGSADEVLNWVSFLKRKGYKIAPDHFFYQTRMSDVPFTMGMHLEAIDQNGKVLRPATVKAIKGRLVLIGFDGWEE